MNNKNDDDIENNNHRKSLRSLRNVMEEIKARRVEMELLDGKQKFGDQGGGRRLRKRLQERGRIS